MTTCLKPSRLHNTQNHSTHVRVILKDEVGVVFELRVVFDINGHSYPVFVIDDVMDDVAKLQKGWAEASKAIKRLCEKPALSQQATTGAGE